MIERRGAYPGAAKHHRAIEQGLVGFPGRTQPAREGASPKNPSRTCRRRLIVFSIFGRKDPQADSPPCNSLIPTR